MNYAMSFYGRKVCFIGAHPDDIELGCGALISHITKQTEVLCVTLSDNQKNPELKNLYKNITKAWLCSGFLNQISGWDHLKRAGFLTQGRKYSNI